MLANLTTTYFEHPQVLDLMWQIDIIFWFLHKNKLNAAILITLCGLTNNLCKYITLLQMNIHIYLISHFPQLKPMSQASFFSSVCYPPSGVCEPVRHMILLSMKKSILCSSQDFFTNTISIHQND